MGSLASDLEDRLNEGGWVLIRKSKHRVYRHPNGATHCLPMRLRDTTHRRPNYLREIERKEQDPTYTTRNPRAMDAPGQQQPPEDFMTPETTSAATPSPEERTPPPTNRRVPWNRWVANRRNDAHISRSDLATALHWTTTTLKKFERGEYTPTPTELRAWATAVGVDVPWDVVPTREDIPKESVVLDKPAEAPKTTPAIGAEAPPPVTPAPEERVILGPWLKKMRMEASDTRAAPLAEALGIPLSTYYDVERGRPRSAEEAEVIRKKATMYFDAQQAKARVSKPSSADASPTVGTPTPPDRALAMKQAAQILSNPRLTDAEVHQLVANLKSATIQLLLNGISE